MNACCSAGWATERKKYPSNIQLYIQSILLWRPRGNQPTTHVSWGRVVLPNECATPCAFALASFWPHCALFVTARSGQRWRELMKILIPLGLQHDPPSTILPPCGLCGFPHAHPSAYSRASFPPTKPGPPLPPPPNPQNHAGHRDEHGLEDAGRPCRPRQACPPP